jgi:hypothetical protein
MVRRALVATLELVGFTFLTRYLLQTYIQNERWAQMKSSQQQLKYS